MSNHTLQHVQEFVNHYDRTDGLWGGFQMVNAKDLMDFIEDNHEAIESYIKAYKDKTNVNV